MAALMQKAYPRFPRQRRPGIKYNIVFQNKENMDSEIYPNCYPNVTHEHSLDNIDLPRDGITMKTIPENMEVVK